MSDSNTEINIFALTDSHQETRKLCCLFSEIINLAPQKGKNTLICDGGDLFKGIYERGLSVDSYLKLRQALPEAKIVFALGNNDFGFNLENFRYLQTTAKIFHQNNIHVLCANLFEENGEKHPSWVDPYILLDIDRKKVLVTSFCTNQIRLQKYGVKLEDIPQSFLKLKDAIQHIEPDALIVINHALYPSSLSIYETAESVGLKIDLLIGGHEHTPLEPDVERRIYYPRAFSRNMLHFGMNIHNKNCELTLKQKIDVKKVSINPVFEPALSEYEEKSGLNTPVAKSTLNLERNYSNPCPLGSFIADCMKKEAKADIAFISTGYMTHALRYEADRILTYYNLVRSFSAVVPLQTMYVSVAELKSVFSNALMNRYTQISGNTRFLQCSGNMGLACRKVGESKCELTQIYIDNEPLLDDDGNPKEPERRFLCAVDPFVGAGEQGFDVLRPLPKETLLKNNQLVLIRDIFIKAVKDAEKKCPAGSPYPYFKLTEQN